MELYFFQHELFEQMYNCSVLTEKEWWDEGTPNKPMGISIFVFNTILAALYLPCLFIIYKTDLIKNGSYKVMLFLGILDVNLLFLNGVGAGYLSYVGAVACSYLHFTYFLGFTGLGCWYTQSTVCVVLSMNRFYTFWKSPGSSDLFEGKRVYFWLAICVTYSYMAAFFQKSLFFSSKVYLWMYNPYYGMDKIEVDRTLYINYGHLIHNVIFSVLLTFFTLALIVQLRVKSRQIADLGDSRPSRIQSVITMQSVVISMFSLLTGFLYILEQYIELPVSVCIALNFIWSISSGAPAVMYLLINQRIRRGVICLCRGKEYKVSSIYYLNTGRSTINRPSIAQNR